MPNLSSAFCSLTNRLRSHFGTPGKGRAAQSGSRRRMLRNTPFTRPDFDRVADDQIAMAVETVIVPDKRLTETCALHPGSGLTIEGYEIHIGRTTGSGASPSRAFAA